MEAQKVHNSSFSGTFQGIEPKNVSESKCQFKNRHRLRLKKIPSHTHKTGSWNLLGVIPKIFDEQVPIGKHDRSLIFSRGFRSRNARRTKWKKDCLKSMFT